jgi:GTPase SAR1 family protein
MIMLGLDGSGKTALLYRMKDGQFVATSPTLGMTIEVFCLNFE